MRFCHASTRSDTEIVLVDSPVERYRDAFADTDEPTVVLGHTHMPFDRLADRRRFINPGSVGMPYGSRSAFWALLGPDITLRRTEYDANAAAETFRLPHRIIRDWPNSSKRTCWRCPQTPSVGRFLAVG